MGKTTRGSVKTFESRLLGCAFLTDDERAADVLEHKMDHAGRRYIEPIAQAALKGVRELNAKAVPAATIKYFKGKVTAHSDKRHEDVASEPHEVVHLPTNTDPPGE